MILFPKLQSQRTTMAPIKITLDPLLLLNPLSPLIGPLISPVGSVHYKGGDFHICLLKLEYRNFSFQCPTNNVVLFEVSTSHKKVIGSATNKFIDYLTALRALG